MLFIVPDDDLSLETSDEKAQLDTDELSGGDDSGGSDGGDKVELDLEDAPFLDDDEDEEDEAPVLEDEEDEEEKGPSKIALLLGNKKLLIGVGAGLLLLVIGVAAFLFWPSGGDEPAQEEKAAVEEQAEQEKPAEGEQAVPEEEAEPKEFLVAWDRFWIEYTDDQGQVRFLVARFSAPTTEEKLAWEIRSKKVQLRDAVFYYLRNKDLIYLTDKKNVATLKKDLLGVINQYLSNGQLEDILIEEYLVK